MPPSPHYPLSLVKPAVLAGRFVLMISSASLRLGKAGLLPAQYRPFAADVVQHLSGRDFWRSTLLASDQSDEYGLRLPATVLRKFGLLDNQITWYVKLTADSASKKMNVTIISLHCLDRSMTLSTGKVIDPTWTDADD